MFSQLLHQTSAWITFGVLFFVCLFIWILYRRLPITF